MSVLYNTPLYGALSRISYIPFPGYSYMIHPVKGMYDMRDRAPYSRVLYSTDIEGLKESNVVDITYSLHSTEKGRMISEWLR